MMSNFMFAVVLEADFNIAKRMSLIPEDYTREEYLNLYRQIYSSEGC